MGGEAWAMVVRVVHYDSRPRCTLFVALSLPVLITNFVSPGIGELPVSEPYRNHSSGSGFRVRAPLLGVYVACGASRDRQSPASGNASGNISLCQSADADSARSSGWL
jgi:hypothetical protein